MAVALITGCSSGFGLALADGFSARGHTVVATARRPDESAALQQLAREERIAVRMLDVTDRHSRDAVITDTVERHGRLDVLVNNAGALHVGAAEDTPEPVARALFEVNYFAPMALSSSAAAAMRRQGAGRIVNITAIGAVLSTPYLSAYCASKHALDAASACMDIELRPFGVRVSSILPGSFRTAIARPQDADADSSPYLARAGAFRAGLLARLATSSDDLGPVVDAALHAATAPEPAPRYVVGTGAAQTIVPLVSDLATLHRAEMTRLDLAP